VSRCERDPVSARRSRPAVARRPGFAGAGGFTLIELIVALTLMALLASVLMGSLGLAARSWDAGDAKAVQVSEMRQAQEFLRAQLAAGYPKRLRKATGFPLLFAGERDELRYAATLPPRVADGGVYYFRLAVQRDGRRGRLVLERVIPDPDAATLPEFGDAERSILAEGIDSLRVSYFGRDPEASDADAPTWRDRWEDTQRLPLLVRIEVVPEKGPPWPPLLVEPRRAPEAGCRAWDARRNRCAGLA
jgi:general secretion pathway protein J